MFLSKTFLASLYGLLLFFRPADQYGVWHNSMIPTENVSITLPDEMAYAHNNYNQGFFSKVTPMTIDKMNGKKGINPINVQLNMQDLIHAGLPTTGRLHIEFALDMQHLFNNYREYISLEKTSDTLALYDTVWATDIPCTVYVNEALIVQCPQKAAHTYYPPVHADIMTQLVAFTDE